MNFKKFILLFFLLIVGIGAQEKNQLRINFGLWGGLIENELQDRFRLDHLIEENQILRYDSNWSKINPFFIYPIGVDFLSSKDDINFIISLSLGYFFPLYEYISVDQDFNTIRFVRFQNIVSSLSESTLGWILKFNRFTFIPKFGSQGYRKVQRYKEESFGRNIGISIGTNFGNNEFDAFNFGYILGFDFEQNLNEVFSIVGGFFSSKAFSNENGKMEFKTTNIFIRDDSFELKTTSQSSNFLVKRERYKLGILYKLNEREQLEVGIRSEKQNFSYPGYKNLALSFTNQIIKFDSNIFELFTDSILWSKENIQQIGYFYITFQRKIDLKN